MHLYRVNGKLVWIYGELKALILQLCALNKVKLKSDSLLDLSLKVTWF